MDFTLNIFIYFALFGLAGLISIFNWRKGFLIFLLYIFFEDIIRMKIFHNNVAIQIAKDLLLLGIYLGCFIEKHTEFRLYKFINSIIALFVLQLANTFNPRIPSLIIGLAALRSNFFYLPLIWIASIYFQDLKNLRKYILFSLAIMAAISIIAFIQSLTGPEIWWNYFGSYDFLMYSSYHTWTKEYVFRPFGIFNNSGRYMQLLFIYFFYILLGWSMQDTIFTNAQRTFFWIMVLFFFAGFIYSISRTSFFVLSITTIIFSLQIKGIRTKELLKQVTIKRIGLLFVIFVIFFLTSTIFQSQVQRNIEFLYKSVVPGHKEFEVVKRINGAFKDFNTAISESGLFGHGTGTNSLGMTYITYLKGSNVESGYAVIVWESGIIGLILWIILWINLFRFFFHLKRISTNYYLANVSYLAMLCIIAFSSSFIGGFQTFQSWIFNILLWTFFGTVIAIFKSEQYQIAIAKKYKIS